MNDRPVIAGEVIMNVPFARVVARAKASYIVLGEKIQGFFIQNHLLVHRWGIGKSRSALWMRYNMLLVYWRTLPKTTSTSLLSLCGPWSRACDRQQVFSGNGSAQEHLQEGKFCIVLCRGR